jgi:hypothetical protein
MVSYQLVASTVLHALDSKSEYGHHRLKKVEYPEVEEQNPKPIGQIAHRVHALIGSWSCNPADEAWRRVAAANIRWMLL